MSNPDRDPPEVHSPATTPGPGSSGIEVITAREVPLGGLRAMTVRRTLPTRQRSTIGAWCFVDHYGPDPVAETGGMSVAPHPHTGLQTVSWLFRGEIEHRDSTGAHAMVRPGELNLMTAGSGVSHSEVSTPDTDVLHGAQLWVALPDADRHAGARFDQTAGVAIGGDGWRGLVFLGALAGASSPAPTATPLLGAELTLDPGAEIELAVEAAYEHGMLVDTGAVTIDGEPVATSELGYRAAGPRTLRLAAGPDGARVLLLGGEPFPEPLVMWWNFVGRTHDEIVAARNAWQAQVTQGGGTQGGVTQGGVTQGGEPVPDAQQVSRGPYGIVIGDRLPPIPAPPLPNARLTPRR